jgi:formylglycine-generating enzyme required for sulfatase activity
MGRWRGNAYPLSLGEGVGGRACEHPGGAGFRDLPRGAYPAGVTPCGALDMSGNVWEWTHSLYQPYPYRSDDGREDPLAAGRRTLRGGAWYNGAPLARVSYRTRNHPADFDLSAGFRVVVAPAL